MKGKLVTRTVVELFVIKCPEDGKIGRGGGGGGGGTA